jgi:hypothetical protein
MAGLGERAPESISLGVVSRLLAGGGDDVLAGEYGSNLTPVVRDGAAILIILILF